MMTALRFCGLSVAVSLLIGCGGAEFGPIGSITGKLTMNGQALPDGTKLIFMQPTNGYAGFGFTDAEGAYNIQWRRSGANYDGLPVGTYQVMLVPAGTADVDEMSADEMLDGGPAPAPKASLPIKYLRATTSGLEYTITEGENTIDIDLSA